VSAMSACGERVRLCVCVCVCVWRTSTSRLGTSLARHMSKKACWAGVRSPFCSFFHRFTNWALAAFHSSRWAGSCLSPRGWIWSHSFPTDNRSYALSTIACCLVS
jgi:hypothetical protein